MMRAEKDSGGFSTPTNKNSLSPTLHTTGSFSLLIQKHYGLKVCIQYVLDWRSKKTPLTLSLSNTNDCRQKLKLGGDQSHWSFSQRNVRITFKYNSS